MVNTVCSYLIFYVDILRQGFNQFCGCCILCFFSFISFSQDDTTKFEGVTIIGNHPKIEEHVSYSRKEIIELAPADLGVLLKRVAGATVADYGGIGSMKTLSVRGLGSTHTGLLINGYPNSNPQNSQVDFGRIQLDNIENASVQLSPSADINIPASSKMQGNVVSISTFEQSFATKPLMIRSSTIIGSFGRKEIHSSLKTGTKNSFLSISGNRRSYEGDFDYTLPFDLENTSRQRSNNNMDSYFFSLGGGKKWKSKKGIRHRARIFGNLNHIDRALPGAIILYSSPSNEELLTASRQIGGDYSLFGKRFSLRSFLNVSNKQLRYYDPDYFNNDGFIDNQYQNRNYSAGINAKMQLKNVSLLLGNDIQYNELMSSRDLGFPQRFSNVSMLGADINLNYFTVAPSLFHHYIDDRNTHSAHTRNYQRWNPQLQLSSTEKLFENLQLTFWYKRSSRAPSFNELYYSQIGNTSLLPEESEQTNLGYIWLWEKGKLSGSVSGNIFYNQLTNKIVALPTQNLFVWSIQNVGKVESYGKDLTFALNFTFSDHLKVDFSSTTTFQSVSDQSVRNSPTYGHQIANTPKWTNASDIQMRWKNFSAGVSSLFIGKRYALNENIPANELDPYLVFNANLGYTWQINNRHELFFQAGVKNIMDSQYFHINYFVMPGRNYFLKIAYEL